MPSTKEILLNAGFVNVDLMIRAAKEVGLPLYIAAGLLAKESMGKNIYGHDEDGIFNDRRPVTPENYKEFRRRLAAGETSNGVGPTQITSEGFFLQADRQGLDLANPYDNMLFGFQLMSDHLNNDYSHASLVRAGTRYNGVPEYGTDFARLAEMYRSKLSTAVDAAGNNPSAEFDAIVNRALEWARGHVGDPRDTKGTWVWNEVYPPGDGLPWCAAFVVLAYLKAGVDFRKLVTNPYLVDNWIAKAKELGAWKTSGERDGDPVCYGWNDGGLVGDHIGISWVNPATSTYRAVEGNTDNAGSGAGGLVLVQERPASVILGWIDIRVLLKHMADKGLISAGNGSVAPTPRPPVELVLPQPFPLPSGHYYGLISGPDQSHGGVNESERRVIRIIQRLLIQKGYVPGVTDVNSAWADGIFEQPTADAVAQFQKAEMPNTQFYGQVWADDYATLSGHKPAPRPNPPALPQPFPLPRGHYYGLITGPDEFHGGINDAERRVIKIIQQRLIAKGYVHGVSSINSPWADGVYEQATADAVTAFQQHEMPGTTLFGQVWADDYAQLAR